jgi:hypothetical protein
MDNQGRFYLQLNRLLVRVYLFVSSGVFKDSVSRAENNVSNVKTNNEVARMWKEGIVS